MEDFATMLQRDYGLNPQGKLTPMSVSRGGVGINNNGGMARVGLMGRGRHGAEGTSGSATFLLREEVSEESLPFGGIGSTSLSRAWQGKGADEPFGGGAAVEYDDVFGGPPRYMPSRYGPQTTLSTLDEVFKVQSRPQSFKGTSLPVFELPVFGDDIYGGSSSISRAAVVGYEDVFNGGPAANATRAANSSQYGEAAVGISRSKPSSRSSSRRLSPIHPSVLNNVHNSQDEQLPRTVSAEPARPRSLASRFLRRSSFSSFDDSAEKPVERTSAIIKNEPVASSVPSSPPPHIAHWQHLRRPLRSFSGNNIRSLGNGTKLDVDDVFGGFPQRGSIVSVQPSSDGRLESVQTHGGMSSVGSPSTVSIDKILCSRESSSTNLKAVSSIHKYGFLGNESTFLSSPSSTDEQGLQEDFIEIRMDQLKDPSVSETIKEGSGKSWLSIVDVNLATHPSSEPPPSRPPPAPATQRKIKTWHDWVAETPVCEPAVVSSPISVDSKSNSSTKGENYGDFDLSSKEMDESKNSVASGTSQHAEETLYFTDLKEKPEGSSLAASSATLKDGIGWSKLRFKSAKETVEMEEQELQARLASVRKRKEEMKRDAKPDHVVHEKREGSEEEQKVQSRDLEGATYEQSGKDVRNDTVPARKPIDNTFEMTERVAAGLRDRAEKIGTEKIGMMAPQWVSLQDTQKNRMDRVSTDSLVLPAELAATESHSTVKKGHANEGWQKADSVTYEEHVQGEVNNSKTFSSVTCSSIRDTLVRNPVAQDSKKDLAQSDHLNNSSIGEAINTKLPSSVVLGDDIDSDPIMDGFQELEGENPERRKARWERELRARDRVAKALEEKQQRDAEIKREQSEKHQIAEASDYQIKRWSAGKEGNLRALLSNLQHVLWSDNGWQPIPLTDLIEGAAVKKAYRKATLFVHPDKVQQKGATIQQKYVAEKVFDILQEAWKTFNTQELF